MARPVVIVTNKIHDLGMQRPHETVDAQYLDYKLTPPDAFMAGLRSCDGIVLRGAVKLSDEVLQSCPRLKVIGKHGAGVEGVDMEAATRLGIIVANSGGANASAVAEGTITPQVDVLSIHVPLAKGTRNLIAMPQIRLMRPNAILVNTARGGIVNERDLAEALSTGLIWGAGFDVFDNEPLEPGNPLLGLANVVVTPHCAGGSESAGVNAATESVGAVLDVLLSGKAPRYVLNRDVLGHTRAALSAA